MLQVLASLTCAVHARTTATFLYQDYSATDRSVYQGSAVSGIAVVSKDSAFTCGHTSEKTCGHTPSGCTANKRTWGTSPYTNCGASDVLVTAHGTLGSLQWLQMFGGTDPDRCDSIAATGTTVVVVGTTRVQGIPNTGPSIGGADVFVLGLAAVDGRQVWGSRFGTTLSDRGSSVKISGDDVYALGYSNPHFDRYGITENKAQCILARMKLSDGTQLYSRELGTDADDACLDMAIGKESVYVVGTAYTPSPHYSKGKVLPTIADQRGRGGSDMLVMKLSASTGQMQWAKLLGGTGHDSALSIALSGDENLFVAGYCNTRESTTLVSTKGSGHLFQQGSYTTNGCLKKLNKDGRELWSRKITTVGSFSNIVLAGGRLFVSGSTVKGTDIHQFGTSGKHIKSVGHLKVPAAGDLNSFENTDLAVITGLDGAKQVFVSAIGLGKSEGTTTGLLFKLSLDNKSPGVFTSTGPSSRFGQQDEVSFVTESAETVALVTATGHSKHMPMIRLEPVQTGGSTTVRVRVERRNKHSRQWCSDASVSAKVGITAVSGVNLHHRMQANSATKLRSSTENLLNVDVPTTIMFTNWKASNKGGSGYASIETAEVSVTIHNSILGDPTKSIATQAIVTLELIGPCSSSTTHGGGCTIATDHNSGRVDTVALLVQGKASFDDEETRHTADLFANLTFPETAVLCAGAAVVAFCLCVCLCNVYVIRPTRTIAEEQRQVSGDIFEQIKKKMAKMSPRNSVSRWSPRNWSPRNRSPRSWSPRSQPPRSRNRVSPSKAQRVPSFNFGDKPLHSPVAMLRALQTSPTNPPLALLHALQASPRASSPRALSPLVSPSAKSASSRFTFDEEDIARKYNKDTSRSTLANGQAASRRTGGSSRKKGTRKLHDSLQGRARFHSLQAPTIKNPTLRNNNLKGLKVEV